MSDKLTLRILKNTKFSTLYHRFITDDKLSPGDYQKILSIAIILINSSDIHLQHLGYRIVVIFSNRTKNYKPLYEIAINKGLYNIAKFIEITMSNQSDNFFVEFNSAILEQFKSNDIFLSDYQYRLNDFNNTNFDNSISIIAPTSYGKTELILEIIRNFSNQNICVITPTKSLLNQTRQRILKAKINGVSKIVVHPDMYNDQDASCVAVLTQERLLALLKDHESLYFDCVVIDEAHNLLTADDRNKLLASAIVMLNARNRQTVFKFLTPFLTNENNLKIRYSHYKLLSFAVTEYIKTEKIYLYDVRNGNKLFLYDQFMDSWCELKTDKNNDSISFIVSKGDKKNIIYLNKPTDIEDFARKMLQQLPDIDEISPEFGEAIKHISEHINPEYTLVKCLRKGIAYHHGSVPDTIRSYIEHLYKNHSELKYLLTTSTLLEGVNVPATKMFILDNRKGKGNLSKSQFKNLIGRICRFNEIFDSHSGGLEKLEPEIYFVFDSYYPQKANIRKFIQQTMKVEAKIYDDAENILLESVPIKDDNRSDLRTAEAFIENYQPNCLKNYKGNHATTEIGKACIRNAISFSEINVFEEEENMQNSLQAWKSFFSKINTVAELLNAINEIFISSFDESKHDAICRLSNEAARRYYGMLLDWKINNESLSKIIMYTVNYWRSKLKNEKNPIVYVGKWGDVTRNNGIKKHWTYIAGKTSSELINLAIVRIKEEQDFIDNDLMRFVEVLNDCELVSEELYLQLKYGTTNQEEIVLVRNGVSLNLAKLLREKYSSHITIDTLFNTVSIMPSLVEAMESNQENKILVFEATSNVIQ